jgi:hypothetical protein
MVAAAFALQTPSDKHVRQFARSIDEQAGILPIGTATSAFWLAPRSRLLWLTVRVVDRGAGQPGGYQGQVIPLSEESFTELERAVHDDPPTACALRVSRIWPTPAQSRVGASGAICWF